MGTRRHLTAPLPLLPEDEAASGAGGTFVIGQRPRWDKWEEGGREASVDSTKPNTAEKDHPRGPDPTTLGPVSLIRPQPGLLVLGLQVRQQI